MVPVMWRTRWTMGLGVTIRMLGLRRDTTSRARNVAASKKVTPERSTSMVALPKLASQDPILPAFATSQSPRIVGVPFTSPISAVPSRTRSCIALSPRAAPTLRRLLT